MSREEILQEMVNIYQKYWKVVMATGTVSMSPADSARMVELQAALDGT